MKSFTSIAFFAASASAATSTLVSFIAYPSTGVVAGESYTLRWESPSESPVKIILREGRSTDLDTIETLAAAATGTSYVWTVDSSYADNYDYALEIAQDGSAPNYSGQFSVSGGDGVASSVSASASASRSSSKSASSASKSSASASRSSASASASASASSASASASSASASASESSASASTSSTPTSVPSNGAGGIQSPIALIFGAVAAMFYLA